MVPILTSMYSHVRNGVQMFPNMYFDVKHGEPLLSLLLMLFVNGMYCYVIK